MPTFGWLPKMQLALNSAHPLFRKILGQGGNFLTVLWTQVFVSLKVYVKKCTLYIYMQTTDRSLPQARTHCIKLYDTIKISLFNHLKVKTTTPLVFMQQGLKPSREHVCSGCTYFARALKEWLNDLAAKCSRVCTKTSIFSGLKLNPSSEQQ